MSVRRELIGAVVFTAALFGFGVFVLSIKNYSPAVARFEGGAFGDEQVYETDAFSVANDWSLELETKGEFSAAAVANVFGGGTNLNMRNGTTGRWEFADGGRFTLKIKGNGVWRATIRQGSGKLP